MKEKISFSFGKNWQRFLKNLDENNFENAEISLVNFLNLNTLKDKSFLDIGCGSGLFSYTAFKLGAKKIISFDIDASSIECCKYLHKRADNPKNWEIYKGSILDSNFISKLEKFDIVYAWGVLHHSGKMWDSIKNSTKLVNEGGYLYIGIYNKIDGARGSLFWLKIKKFYNLLPRFGKTILESLYMLPYIASSLIKMEKPLKKIKKDYKAKRGMNFKIDIADWLGGYPYEFATVEEIFKFMKTNFPDFNLVNIKTTNYLGNNWYLFKRKDYDYKK